MKIKGVRTLRGNLFAFARRKRREKNLLERKMSTMENGISCMDKNKLLNTVKGRAKSGTSI